MNAEQMPYVAMSTRVKYSVYPKKTKSDFQIYHDLADTKG